jgi:hypothetical protein
MPCANQPPLIDWRAESRKFMRRGEMLMMDAASQTIKSVKIRKLHICNFKAFEDIEIDFPEPRMNEDPDVIVMGSKNGLGKTTVLEAVSILFFMAVFPESDLDLRDFSDVPINSSWAFTVAQFIRAGKQESRISGDIEISGCLHQVSLTLGRKGRIKIESSIDPDSLILNSSLRDSHQAEQQLILSLGGLTPDPLLLPRFMYFHSYRMVQGGNPTLGSIVSKRTQPYVIRFFPEKEFPISAFKLEILRTMMIQSGFFKTNRNGENVEVILEKLQSLTERYAGGRIDKPEASQDNAIEFGISPVKGGESFAFDGLSSGQKEIISTFFMIWHHTHDSPGIVLIDEPELHLNAEWQIDFIRQLHKLVPENQYIIATHSEDIFSSVDQDRRMLLVAKEGVK